MPGRVDPFIANKFFLKIDGYGDLNSIVEVSAPKMEAEVVELLQSTEKGQQVRIKTLGAQRQKSGKLTVKYATFFGDKCLKWRKDVSDGKMAEARKNMTLFVYKSDGSLGFEINFVNAFPNKLALPTLTTKSNEAMINTLEIEYEELAIKIV